MNAALSTKQLIIIRPYRAFIRQRIVAVLNQLGYAAEAAVLIPAATPDDVVLSQLETMAVPQALLMPFHAHQDTQGTLVDGLALMLKIRTRFPAWAKTPVVMPVSQVGHAGYLLRVQELKVATFPNHAAVPERELDNPALLADRLRMLGF